MLLELIRAVARLADLPEPTESPEEVRETADEILSRPEYDQAQPVDDDPSWFEQIVEDIGNWFADIFDDLLGGATGGGALPNFVGYLILFVLFAGVAGLIVWAIRSSSWSAPRRRPKRKDSVFVDVEEYRTTHEWLRDAEEHERAGRWREGILCRYRALVTELVEREFLSDIAGKTSGEYDADVRAKTAADPLESDVAPAFSAATELFEMVWYGAATCGEAERDRFAGLAERVLAALPGALDAGKGAGGAR